MLARPAPWLKDTLSPCICQLANMMPSYIQERDASCLPCAAQARTGLSGHHSASCFASFRVSTGLALTEAHGLLVATSVRLSSVFQCFDMSASDGFCLNAPVTEALVFWHPAPRRLATLPTLYLAEVLALPHTGCQRLRHRLERPMVQRCASPIWCPLCAD